MGDEPASITWRQAILGRGLFEVFPDNPDDLTATGVSNLSDSLERVLRDKAPDAMAVQKYDIRRPEAEAEGGGFEVRYWSPVNSPVIGQGGQVSYIIHRVEDVSEFLRLKQRGVERRSRPGRCGSGASGWRPKSSCGGRSYSRRTVTYDRPTSRPLIVGEIPDEMLVHVAKDQRHLTLIRSLGLKSFLCVPLVVSGKPLGVSPFATSESGRTYTGVDLALAVDLAQRAGVAIENTQLYHRALRGRRPPQGRVPGDVGTELRKPAGPHPQRHPCKFSTCRGSMRRRPSGHGSFIEQVHHLVRLVDESLPSTPTRCGWPRSSATF